jgi:hypothetical protein
MAIEIRHTKRAVVYRVVISSDGADSGAVSKTFRTKAAAEAWERDVLEARAAAEHARSVPTSEDVPSEPCGNRARRA